MIIIKTEAEIAKIGEGGKILSLILKKVAESAKPGTTTAELEKLACELIDQAGGRPAFKGYCPVPQGRPYPTALCISINHQVVHAPALPARAIFDGDIVSIDIGMEYPARNGYFTDMAVTFGVGKIGARAQKLIEATKQSLELAIKKVKPGASIYDIGRAVEDYVVSQGFSVVRDLVGHGVGKAVHEEPQIPNFPIEANKRILLKPGMVIAIEPMVNMGRHEVVTGPDGMSIDTADESLSAHFEHTVAVTKTGNLVLTR
ncbi:type I methionyl aminopeptidase [Candidatus Falkowbacteria bacterium]|nr:type I methionyl aminopeptidase [Candidatus Falkowbacteria bacterium]